MSAPAANHDPSAAAVGKQIRLIRQHQALSMQALATRAGISRAWLGEIENGKASPSVDVVRRLANALGVPVGSVLDGRAGLLSLPDPDLARGFRVVRANERLSVKLPSQPFSWELLTPLRGEIQLMVARIAAAREPIELMEHDGQEACFVLGGRLEVALGDEPIVLQTGDCVTFSARLAHGFRNPGPDEATLLNATSPPSLGERWH